MIGLLGKKIGQTRVYNDKGVLIPVTVVLAGPNHVIQCKTAETDGYNAVQLGFIAQKEQRLTKADMGHLRKHKTEPVKKIKEFRDFSIAVKPGDKVGVTIFAQGDYIDAIGCTKGRGFEGVMKRHHFRGGDATHGAKGWRRRAGAIGNRSFPGTVLRGRRCPGIWDKCSEQCRLGNHPGARQDQVLLIKGAIPGSKGDYVIIRESKKYPKAQAQTK